MMIHQTPRRVAALLLCLGLAACSNPPKLFWDIDEGSDKAAAKEQATPVRHALEVPPELRGELEVPMPDRVAPADAGARLDRAKAVVAGKAVSLDARVYEARPDQVFSAVIDAMTALNLPVDSVDSPSGTITTDWVRDNANSPSAMVGVVNQLFGGGVQATRYRYIVRVFRQGGKRTQLQIRTLGQVFINHHWVNKPIKRKVANELFGAVEEQLARLVASGKADASAK